MTTLTAERLAALVEEWHTANADLRGAGDVAPRSAIRANIRDIAVELVPLLLAHVDAVTGERDEKADQLERIRALIVRVSERGNVVASLDVSDLATVLWISGYPDSVASSEGAKQEEPCDCDRGWRGNLVLGTLRRCENGCPNA